MARGASRGSRSEGMEHKETGKEYVLTAVRRAYDFHGNVLLKSMEIEKMPEVDGFIHFCYDALVDRKLLIEGECLEMTESGKRRLAANRFFIQSEGRYTFPDQRRVNCPARELAPVQLDCVFLPLLGRHEIRTAPAPHAGPLGLP